MANYSNYKNVSETIAWFMVIHIPYKRICIRNYKIIHTKNIRSYMYISFYLFHSRYQSKFYVLGTGNELLTAAFGKRSVKRLCLLSDEFPDCLWLFFALFCSCWARSWFSSPGGSSCSECFFLFNDDCSTLILERATTNESFISASSWVSWNSGDDESTANPRFRRQPMIGLGGGAHGNGDSLHTGGVCRNPAIPCSLPLYKDPVIPWPLKSLPF